MLQLSQQFENLPSFLMFSSVIRKLKLEGKGTKEFFQ